MVEAIRKDFRSAGLPPHQIALLEYAEKLTRTPGQMIEADVEKLRASGFADADILDAAEVTAYFNYINRIADGLGVDPEPDWK